MRTEDLLEAIGGAEDELLDQSEEAICKKYSPWKKWIPLAASVCIVIGLGGALVLGHFGGGFTAKNENASADMMQESVEDMGDLVTDQVVGQLPESEGSTSEDGIIFTMTAFVEEQRVSVERNLVYDFSASTVDNMYFTVEDSYTFTNPTEEEIKLQILYPYKSVSSSDVEPTLFGVNNKKLESVSSLAAKEEEAEQILEAYVTIPAGGRIMVTAKQAKNAYVADGTKEDFLYKLAGGGENPLSIQNASVTVIDSELVSVEIEDFGFDLQSGNRTGTLEVGKDYIFRIKMLDAE